MMNKNYETRMKFITNSFEIAIDDAMLSRFPDAEWLEVSSKSRFESPSLLSAIVSHYCENAEQLLLTISSHTFDVMFDNEVILYFSSPIQPIFKEIKPSIEELCRSTHIECDCVFSVEHDIADDKTETTMYVELDKTVPEEYRDMFECVEKYDKRQTKKNRVTLVNELVKCFCQNADQILSHIESHPIICRYEEDKLFAVLTSFESNISPIFV